MGAAVMCARAIVRDLYAPVQGARVMSKGLSGLGVIAFLSAPLGGLLTEVVQLAHCPAGAGRVWRGEPGGDRLAL